MSTQPPATMYKNHRFPGELHARWAIFFDALGVSWEYQPQAFDLPYSGAFVPDFWLPTQQIWIDIKATIPDEDELIKAADLSFYTRSWVYVVWGAIGKHRIYGFNLPFQEQGYDKRFVFTLSNYTQDLMVSGPLRSDDAYQFIGYCPTSQQAVMQKAQDVLTNVLLLEAYESASTAHLEQETAE